MIEGRADTMGTAHPTTREEFAAPIDASPRSRKDELRAAFAAPARDAGVRCVAIDDLSPAKVACAIAEAFPSGEEMRPMNGFRAENCTSKAFAGPPR
jgi:hypothetical protein